MKKKNGLVLEGGSQRGIFTAGVHDTFLENNIEIEFVKESVKGHIVTTRFYIIQEYLEKLKLIQ